MTTLDGDHHSSNNSSRRVQITNSSDKVWDRISSFSLTNSRNGSLFLKSSPGNLPQRKQMENQSKGMMTKTMSIHRQKKVSYKLIFDHVTYLSNYIDIRTVINPSLVYISGYFLPCSAETYPYLSFVALDDVPTIIL